MNKDLLAALRRIRMVAQYGLEERESRDEMVSTLTYIIEEAGEAINNAKADEARVKMYALLDKKMSVDDMHELRRQAEGKVEIRGEYDHD
jgi:NTP pyrophosphatase (non-canonical NTP hydrolase)